MNARSVYHTGHDDVEEKVISSNDGMLTAEYAGDPAEYVEGRDGVLEETASDDGLENGHNRRDLESGGGSGSWSDDDRGGWENESVNVRPELWWYAPGLLAALQHKKA